MLEVILQWRLAGLEENSRVLGSAGFRRVSDTGEMHGVLVAVYKDSVAIHLECCVASTHAESSGH